MTPAIAFTDKVQPSPHITTYLSLIQGADRGLFRHSLNVQQISSKLHKALGLSPEIEHIIKYGSLLHDVGKFAVDRDVLIKAGVYESAEFKKMQTHPVVGRNLVANLIKDVPARILDIILLHHEKNGGGGYPGKVDKLPFYVEVVAVADIACAMQEHRNYRQGHTLEQSIKEILVYIWDNSIIQLLSNRPELFLLDDKYKTLTSCRS
jgi:HD-GYP domain-containing protein (c-di-GMP phosphodiesterase class II)